MGPVVLVIRVNEILLSVHILYFVVLWKFVRSCAERLCWDSHDLGLVEVLVTWLFR